MPAPEVFVKALQGQPISCPMSRCPGPVESIELSRARDKIKTFSLKCGRCGWQDQVTGHEDSEPPWDEASLQAITDEHLLHLQPVCPFDHAPVVFISLPNPRRKARYRISCFYCGRQVEMDWPPQESKW